MYANYLTQYYLSIISIIQRGLNMAGKGSKPRPLSVDPATFANNWDRIFGKKEHNNCGTPECCGTCDDKETSDENDNTDT